MDDKEKLEQLKEGVLKPDEKLQKFDDLGLTDDYLIGKLKDQCEAEREIERRISKKEVKLIKIPLWKIQQDAVKEANKLKGNYPAEKHEHTGDIIFHSNVPEPDMPEKEEKPPPKEHPDQLEPGIGEHEVKDIESPEWVKEEPTSEIESLDSQSPLSLGGISDKEFKDHHRSRRESGK